MHAGFLQGLVRMEEEAETTSTWPKVPCGRRRAALEQVMTAPSAMESTKQVRVAVPLLRETTPGHTPQHVPVEVSAEAHYATPDTLAPTSCVGAKFASGSSTSIDDLMSAAHHHHNHQKQQQESAPPAEHIAQPCKGLHSLSLELIIVTSVVQADTLLQKQQQQQQAERSLKSFSSPSSFLHINASDLSLDSSDAAPGSAPPATALVTKVHRRRSSSRRALLAAKNGLVLVAVD